MFDVTTQALEAFNPYSTASAMFGKLPQWVSSYDAQRIMSYQIYEQIYWNAPDTFKLTLRGSDEMPIYIPTARTIVDTTNRYVGCDYGIIADPDYGSPADQQALRVVFSKLFRRERFWAKFNNNKRYGLIRGDWCFHIIGNDLKEEGKRIRIDTIDPAAYFPVTHPDDPDHIIGCHIVEQIKTDDGYVIKRQTYQRGADPVQNDGTDTLIYNSIALFSIDDWEDIKASPVNVIKPLTALPPEIKAIPVYHIRNIETPGDPYGSSELRGFERIMSAVNQAVSDEELALALDGLGVYATDAGRPIRSDGTEGEWSLGPGRVVELPAGTAFNRVSGVANISPMQEHIHFLINALKEASGTPDIAIGKVESADVSGISLLIQMGPILAKADERDELIAGVMDQMLHDISVMWLPAYEGINLEAIMVSGFGDRLPQDRKTKIDEIAAIANLPGVVDADWVRSELSKLGYTFDADVGARAMDELGAINGMLDAFAGRLAAEADLDQG